VAAAATEGFSPADFSVARLWRQSTVNQGPQYSGPGIMIPSLSYSPGEGVAAPGAYPYIGRYPYRRYYPRYSHHMHSYYWHHRHPLHTRG
jgi:hypothetical protein